MKKKMLSVLFAGLFTLSLFTGCGQGKTEANTASPEVTKEQETRAPESASQAPKEEQKATESNVLSNGLFSITMPEALSGTYEADIQEDSIYIFHKESKDAGFGGMIFGVWATDAFQGGPYRKLGELSDGKGKVYEVLRAYATEIQYDYNLTEAPETYEQLDQAVESVLSTMAGVGGLTYTPGAGMKGEELYGEVLGRYVTAIKEGLDANGFEKAGMSAEFYAAAQYAEGDPLDGIGYAYRDINNDGIEELFIGPMGEEDWKGVAYDIYTIQDHAPALVVSGGARNRYFDYGDNFICNEYSGGAAESGRSLYALMNNSTELVFQIGYKYDGYEDEQKPWFMTYDGQTYEPISEEEFNAAMEDTSQYVRLDYTPLSGIL